MEGIVARGISDKRQRSRRELLHTLDSLGKAMPENPHFEQLDRCEENAYGMIFGDARKLFELSEEKDEIRERYGRTTFGQSCLMARRLVEKGVPYITINYRGWDTHKQHFETMRRKLPEMDAGMATLLQDLADRGLLDSTIIWWSGEFGRGPKIQWKPPWNGGRSHHGKCFCAVVAGGGFKGGHVVGASNAKGVEVAERPVYPQDLIGSMYALLGIDPDGSLPNPRGLKAQVMPSSEEGGGRLKPHIGYLYPGGGQQGSVVRITAGGQFLTGAKEVYVSGEGVRASVIKYIKPLRNLQKEQRQLLQKRLKEVREKRLAEFSGSGNAAIPAKKKFAKKALDEPKAAKKGNVSKKKNVSKKENAAKTKEVKLPDHPLLYDLENKNLRELAHISNVIFFPRNKRQINRQLAESVLIEVTIEPDAAPGNRELRFGTKTGLTNPMVFQVGQFPEIRELEPNNRKAYSDLPNLPKGSKVPKEKPVELPAILNGQIMPGDVDRFRFRAQRGQQLVIEAHARSLIPYLADAVPGWFQATLALYDAKGKEVAFADDYRFNPDPVLFYQIAEDGEYELEIRDSIYRGREDFVYRIAVGEQSFITQMFPLGGRAGVKTVASIKGWNLAKTQLPLDTQPGDDCIRQTAYHKGKQLSNSIAYAVDTLPECEESESNDTIKRAQQVELPKIINGRIARPGDVDVFQFKGSAGDEVVAEVYGRRLNSPLDSLLRLTDASGKVLEWNDDHMIKDEHLHKDMMGLVTHYADSYLLAELPKDGTYYVHLADSQHHGGQAYGYRLRIAAPQPDFALRVTPSSFSMRAGAIVPLCVHVLRKDGYDGEIEV
ncbi:MAG: DUF1501 domain-containing protein, partial [Planctomycetota bacterium]